ncbi:MAG: lipopolysaccharide kinase InaA family protein [Planctomycetota bacterium]
MIDPKLLNTPLGLSIRRAGLDTVDGAFACQAAEDLVKPGLQHRRRGRLVLHDETGKSHELYLKRYASESLPVRLRRWWTYGLGGGPAGVEVRNIARVAGKGMATMRAAAWGCQGGLLGVRRSYVLVTGVPGEALSRVEQGPIAGKTDLARQMTQALADLARTLHTGGLAHRDFYASHIFLEEAPEGPRLHLIDLARVIAPRVRLWRWIVKDLAQLRFSMPEEWRINWWRDFLGWYRPGASPRTYRRIHYAVEAKVVLMRRHEERRLNRHWQEQAGGKTK